MASSTMPALDGSPNQPQSRHGYGQSRSHHRKAAPDRIPLLSDTQMPEHSLTSPFRSSHESNPHAERLHGVGQRVVQQNGDPQRSKYSGGTKTRDTEKAGISDLSENKASMEGHMHWHPESDTHDFTHSQGNLASFPGIRPQRSTPMASSASALSLILVPLPFVLSSLVLTSQLIPLELEEVVNWSQTEGTNPTLPPAARAPSRYLSFLGVCSLTAATLVLVGFIGEITGSPRSKSNPRTSSNTYEAFVSIGSFRRIAGRILSIGLPFYAVSKLGGERIAIVFLVALAAELVSKNPYVEETSRPKNCTRLALSRKWTILALALQCLSDLLNLTNNLSPLQTASGYLALGVSIFLLPWPYPSMASKVVTANASVLSQDLKIDGIVTAQQDNAGLGLDGLSCAQSPMISTARDTDLTIASGVLSTIISFVVFVLSSQQTQTLTLKLLLGGSIVSIASAASLILTDFKAFKSQKGLSLIIGLSFTIIVQELIDSHPLLPILLQVSLAIFSYLGVYLDAMTPHKKDHLYATHSHSHKETHSKFTTILLRWSEDWSLLHSILLEKDSRRILYFMSLNFAFMLVQTFYGWATGSLGLLSDSIHMFFDCAALVVGLGAAVLSKRPPSLRFPYGFEKMDTLAGFANGIFLMLISVEIVYEALERLIEGSHMQRLGELLVVSALGLAVNLVGMFAFGHAHHGHGHSHSHDGHDDAHSHGERRSDNHHHSHSHFNGHNLDHNPPSPLPSPGPSPFPVVSPTTPAIAISNSHTHTHAQDHHHHHHDHHNHHHGPHGHHHHGHSHGHENMEGIFLHVLADTLGSVAVVISTILVHFTGWVGWDPIASCIIAVLIFASAIPLVRSCAKNLLLIVPEGTEFDLREALAGVGGLRGVANVCAPRFWIGSGEKAQVEGVMHVIASKGSDIDDVRERALAYLAGKGMTVLVQVERDGEGRCWCGSTTKTA